MFGSATWIMFLHSKLAWAKSLDSLYFFRSIVTIYILFRLSIVLLGEQLIFSSSTSLLIYVRLVQTISNSFHLYHHPLMLFLDYLESTHISTFDAIPRLSRKHSFLIHISISTFSLCYTAWFFGQHSEKVIFTKISNVENCLHLSL